MAVTAVGFITATTTARFTLRVKLFKFELGMVMINMSVPTSPSGFYLIYSMRSYSLIIHKHMSLWLYTVFVLYSAAVSVFSLFSISIIWHRYVILFITLLKLNFLAMRIRFGVSDSQKAGLQIMTHNTRGCKNTYLIY